MRKLWLTLCAFLYNFNPNMWRALWMYEQERDRPILLEPRHRIWLITKGLRHLCSGYCYNIGEKLITGKEDAWRAIRKKHTILQVLRAFESPSHLLARDALIKEYVGTNPPDLNESLDILYEIYGAGIRPDHASRIAECPLQFTMTSQVSVIVWEQHFSTREILTKRLAEQGRIDAIYWLFNPMGTQRPGIDLKEQLRYHLDVCLAHYASLADEVLVAHVNGNEAAVLSAAISTERWTLVMNLITYMQNKGSEVSHQGEFKLLIDQAAGTLLRVGQLQSPEKLEVPTL